MPLALSLVGDCEKEVKGEELAGDLFIPLTYFGICGQRRIWFIVADLLESLVDNLAG